MRLIVGTVMVLLFSTALHARSRINPNKILLLIVERDLEMYHTDCGSYPTSAQGLMALETAPQISPLCPKWGPDPYLNWKRYYEENKKQFTSHLGWYHRLLQWIKLEAETPVPLIPIDYFGHELVYTSDGKTFNLISYGRDGIPGGAGPDADISLR